MRQLSFEEFSRLEIVSGDLDPDYIFINRVCSSLSLQNDFKSRWIFLKTVIYSSESELRFLFGYEDFKTLSYGSERQKQKNKAKEYWRNLTHHADGSAEDFFFHRLDRNAQKAMQQIETVSGFGPWAAWKMIDLASCCLGIKFDYSDIDFRVAYKYPLRGMLLIAGESEDNVADLSKDDRYYREVLREAISKLGTSRKLLAPCCGVRRVINIQEMETLFCKYHSYRHNHYQVGEDSEKLLARVINSRYPAIRKLAALVPNGSI